MKIDGRRKSENFEDRRSGGAGKVAGLGIGGLLITGLIVLLSGGNIGDVINQVGSQALQGSMSYSQDYVPTAEDNEFVEFSKVILAGTEDVWVDIFKKSGLSYEAPKIVFFNSQVQSACGGATSQSGPFYCSADKAIYLDVSFFKEMQRNYGGGGDFAYAYVISHEVGHHVQNLLGTLGKVQQQRQRATQKEANRLTVRLELQADFYAGIWAHYDNKRYNSIDDRDVEAGMRAANAIGDDRLQKQAQGYAVPDSFTHGTSAQRMAWLKKGLTTGDLSLSDSFSPAYESL